MGSATTQRLIPFAATLIYLILIHSTPASSSLENRTAYEVLEDYNFPVGLLPKGVKGYDLNITTGYISNGKLSTLEGIYVRVFFMWMQIVEILRYGDELFFSVGVLFSVFPIDYFEESPQCGCGFQCGGGQVRMPRINPFVSPYEGS
ncbi:uncharacterized protein LOC117930957 [Vitis riparia]|uniref:uncharacterized protein LOC100256166 n=1 Tax=Vitis vinifera TaxID=29760 RepID=UPI0005402A6A|nr:uncharacterized protein LOC100256166 [Vitis vinifera]XP_034707665.1 uncharacterized protein LOC117930957 [Vitis riparia]|eukprot:XP_010659663.1 PREDICTED: uncharacterized protein LOC100256166 [Vitis vinifera]